VVPLAVQQETYDLIFLRKVNTNSYNLQDNEKAYLHTLSTVGFAQNYQYALGEAQLKQQLFKGVKSSN
jgi:hypothetical protein